MNAPHYRTVIKFTTSASRVSSLVAMSSAAQDDRGRPLPAVCSIELNWLWATLLTYLLTQLLQKVVRCLSSQFLRLQAVNLHL